jgi:hypothetical protein
MTTITRIAGTLTIAPVKYQPVWTSYPNGALEKDAGIIIPKSFKKLHTYPDHPTATDEAPKRYSRMRSQPMIHAKSFPNVAYA